MEIISTRDEEGGERQEARAGGRAEESLEQDIKANTGTWRQIQILAC
jgi:hypothetical protein